MDSFLQKFSLQNLLRQFFCGVVFFVPLWLFARTRIVEILGVEKGNTGVYLAFAALASVVGTIIYHLEKNLYSYPLMYVYEKWIFKGNETDFGREKGQGKLTSPPEMKFHIWLLWIMVAIFVMMVLLECRHFVSWPWIAILVFAGFWLCVVTHLLLECESVVPMTMKVWKIEYLAAKQRVEEVSSLDDKTIEKYSAAEKIATWSDFIHCVQSCCFAWIFGSLLAYYITGTIVRGFYQGLTTAFMLLAAEMIIDMHRYRFVRKMVPADAKEAENGGGGDNHEQQKDREEKIDAESMINASEIESSPAEQVLPACRKRPDSNYAMSKSPQDGTKRCFFNLDMDKLQKVLDGVYIFDFEICEESQVVRKMWCAPSVVLRDYCESILKKINRQEGPLSYSLYIDYQTGAVYDALNAPHEQMLFFLAPITNGSSFTLIFKSFK
ncbi:MAG: hypothetical protein IJE88_06205 [Akkermansia sp.]|nr:hypothetical protein [Akkermansia sp.]